MILKKRLIVIFAAGSLASVSSMNCADKNIVIQQQQDEIQHLEQLKAIASDANEMIKSPVSADKKMKVQGTISEYLEKLGINAAHNAICAINSVADGGKNAKIEDAARLIGDADVELQKLRAKYKKNLNHDRRLFFEVLRQSIIGLKIALWQEKLEAKKPIAHKVEGDEVSTPEEV